MYKMGLYFKLVKAGNNPAVVRFNKHYKFDAGHAVELHTNQIFPGKENRAVLLVKNKDGKDTIIGMSSNMDIYYTEDDVSYIRLEDLKVCMKYTFGGDFD